MDPTTSEIVRNSLVYASEEMGIALRNSSYSPNIRERMDHSAAIFDNEGRLLAQAEHIPVHLGSLLLGLRKPLDYCDHEDVQLEPFTMLMVNNPYIAGTHLNDVTVIRPVYHSNRLVGYTANKAHHADVGGKVPGSISVDAKTLFEEGVVVDPKYLIRKKRIRSEYSNGLRIEIPNPKREGRRSESPNCSQHYCREKGPRTRQEVRMETVPRGMRRISKEDRAADEIEAVQDTRGHLSSPGQPRRSRRARYSPQSHPDHLKGKFESRLHRNRRSSIESSQRGL